MFAKIASSTTSCIVEREIKKRVAISYFFSASSQLMSL
jgi:hypothetical protein